MIFIGPELGGSSILIIVKDGSSDTLSNASIWYQEPSTLPIEPVEKTPSNSLTRLVGIASSTIPAPPSKGITIQLFGGPKSGDPPAPHDIQKSCSTGPVVE